VTTGGAVCPKGHASDQADFCSVCGAKLVEPRAGGPRTGDRCPHCEGERDESATFCEVCGYDFVSATLPAAPQVRPADPPRVAAVASAGRALWVVVTADRTFYDRNDVTEVQFPLGAAERSFPLVDERVTIGRRSKSRGIQPTIDLSEPPEDAAVSHGHATLIRQADGSYVLVDNGSTNGTYMNGSSDPIAPHEPVAVSVGDQINLGAWTSIHIDERRATA